MPRHKFSDTRERIETAATRLFVQKGVAETSVRDIARAVGLSEGALYRHFDGKDDLVWQAFESHYIAFASELKQLAAGQTSGRNKIAAMIRGFCRAHDLNPTLFNFLLFVQHGQLARLAGDAPTPVTVMRAVIEQAIRNAEIPPQDPDLACALVLGTVLQPATFAAYGRLPVTLAPICERLVAASWAVVTVT
ncbi:MAG: TetR/AcrR family transcriptional regulator [Vicinamibacterales bacterium]